MIVCVILTTLCSVLLGCKYKLAPCIVRFFFVPFLRLYSVSSSFASSSIIHHCHPLLHPLYALSTTKDDIGIMSGAKLKVRAYFELSNFQTEIMVGVLNITAALGGLFSGALADTLGRKKTVAGACVVFITGSFLMAFANSFGVIVLGRIVTGLGVGAGLMVAPLYTAELAPKRIRGGLVSLNEVAINIGILLGYVLGYAFSDLPVNTGWRVMLGLGAVPPVIILVSLFVLPGRPSIFYF